MADIGDLETSFSEEPRRYSAQELREAAVQYADHYAIPRDLFLGYLGHESNWNPRAKNPNSSATGLGQIIDATGRDLGLNITGGPDDDRYDPGKAMDAIGRLFVQRYEAVGGDWKKALLSVGEPHEAYYQRVKNRAARESGDEAPLPDIREAPVPSVLAVIKDYLGYQDLPKFLPVFNKEAPRLEGVDQPGQWEAKTVYEARKLFHQWEEPTELERVLGQGLNALSLGWSDYLAEDITGRPLPRPESIPGTLAGAGLELAGFIKSPYQMAQMLMGGRLAPTRTGLRGIAQLMAEGGATLGLATGLTRVLPDLLKSEELTEGTWQFVQGTAAGALVGVLFPVLGARPAGAGEAMTLKQAPGMAARLAAGLAALDFMRTRFHAAPDKGWFTFDDVVRGVMDGSIDRSVLAQKAFDYLFDLYFLSKTPHLLKSVEILRLNKIAAEAAKVNAAEAEDLILEIAKDGELAKTLAAPGTEKYYREIAGRKYEKPPEEAGDASPGTERYYRELEKSAGGTPAPQEKVPVEGAAAAAEPPGASSSPGAAAVPEAGGEGAPAGTPAPSARRLPAYNLGKAVELGDAATVIKALGGFSSKSKIINEVTSPEERKMLIGFTKNPERFPGVVGVDVFLADAKARYPDLFPYETDGEFIRAIIDKTLYKKVDIAKMEAEEAEHYAELEQRDAAIREQAAREGLDLKGLNDLEADVAREIAAERAARELESDLESGQRSPTELDLSWEEGQAEYGLASPRPKVSKLETRLEEIAAAYPETDREKAAAVLHALPEADNFQVAAMAADPELFSQAARGNLSATEREQLFKKATDAGQQMGLPGLGTGLFYSGGPDTAQLGKDALSLGQKIIKWVDDRLERNLPIELRDPDASKHLGVILLKLTQFEDAGRTYPSIKRMFEEARRGLAVKSRLAQEFSELAAPYFKGLNPEERANVDRLLVERDLINSPAFGLEWRLGTDMEIWRDYLLNPRETIRERGSTTYEGLGLTRKEAEGAFAVRMVLDYARADILDRHSRIFQEWAEAHGLDRARIKDLVDLLLAPEKMKVEEIAAAYFGPEPGPGLVETMGRFREAMNYWLKEQHEYIPHSRYGDYFLRVYHRESELTRKARGFLQAVDERFPGGRVAALDPEKWPKTPKGNVSIPAGIKLQYEMMKKALEIEAGENLGKDVKLWKGPAGARLVEEAVKRASGELIHVEAAEGRGHYQEKMRRLQEEFPEGEYEIRPSLEKKDPMEIFAETHIPRVWRLISEAQKSRKLPQEVKAAELEAWRDFLAQKGFGAHYIRRKNIPGYETDLLKPLSDYLAGQAGYAGKMEKIRGFSEVFADFPKNQPNLLQVANEYSNYVLSNPYEFQQVRNVIYHLTLGGNLSFHFINSLQNVSVGWAVLGQVSGKPGRELVSAGKDWVKFLKTGRGLREGEAAILARARYEPELSPSGAEEISARAYNPLYRWQYDDPAALTAKALDWAKEFWYGRAVEKFNRESFFLAAYRATEGNYDQALELTRQAHFLYGKETRPEIMRGLGALPGTFLTYSVNYFTLLKNFGKALAGVAPETYGTRKQGAQGLARMFAGAMVTGGLAGGPIVGLWGLMKKAWRQVFGSDLEEDGKEFLAQDLGLGKAGEFAGRALFRGLPAAALGWDISGRVQPNLPFMNLPPGEIRYQDLIAGVIGAGSIPLQRLFQAGYAASEGQYGRALEEVMPVALQNLFKGYRLGAEGATTMTGRPIFTKEGEQLRLGPWEMVSKMVGMQPARLTEHYEGEKTARALERDRRDRVHDWGGELARAIRAGDEAAFQAVIREWLEHNNKMLQKGRLADVVSPESVERAVISRFKPRLPDVSERQMLLRQAGRKMPWERSLAEVVEGQE